MARNPIKGLILLMLSRKSIGAGEALHLKFIVHIFQSTAVVFNLICRDICREFGRMTEGLQSPEHHVKI
ncbi:MAG: hypothetical protein VR75_09930 [Hyphomonadaceae bacterium BRH_c29]|nr:MAG: hypothetical protein VR75_09930 [Hyphomonadaceae bacterium BRH_c29]